MTGAGPHAGDEEARRFDVSISAVARVHGVTVMIALTVAVALAVWLTRRPDDRHRLQNPLSSWIFVGVLQAAIGYTQYFNDVPPLLVGLHVAGATVLWAMTVWLVLGTQAVGSRAARRSARSAPGLVPSRGHMRGQGRFGVPMVARHRAGSRTRWTRRPLIGKLVRCLAAAAFVVMAPAGLASAQEENLRSRSAGSCATRSEEDGESVRAGRSPA